jgi:hypothetical protein
MSSLVNRTEHLWLAAYSSALRAASMAVIMNSSAAVANVALRGTAALAFAVPLPLTVGAVPLAFVLGWP